MNERKTGLLHSAAIVSSLTLLSRLLGFVRDMAIAYVLGAGYRADVFFVAFRIPNLFRRLYADGSLSLPYMPELGRTNTLGDDASFNKLVSNLGGLAGSFYLGLVLLGVTATPLFVSILAPGFVGKGAKWQLAVSLSRCLFPYVLCIGMAGFAMAILNTREHFGAPAAAPGLLNLSILALLGIGNYFKLAPEWALTWGVILGGAFQLGLQWLWVRRLAVRWSWSRWWRASEALRVSRLLVVTILGAAVYHLNIFVATIFASFLTAGSISYLYYAERLVQFPLGIFGGAIGTSVLPRLTRESALEEWSAFRQQLAGAVELVFFLTLPAAAGLWVIRVPLVHLLFQRGEFTEISTLMTAEALGYYSLGLWAVAGSRVLVGAWYALEGAYITVWTGIASLAINVLLSALLIGPMQQGGLALATSIGAIVNLFLLISPLGKRLGGIYGWRLFRSACCCLLASLIMALAVGGLCRLTYGQGRPEGGLLALVVACLVASGVFVYLGSVLLLGVPEGVRKLWADWRQQGSE